MTLFCQSILFIYGQVLHNFEICVRHSLVLAYSIHLSHIEWPNVISLISILILAFVITVCVNLRQPWFADTSFLCLFYTLSESFIGVIILNPIFMSMFLKFITYDINANVLGFSIWSKSSIMKSSLISGDL